MEDRFGGARFQQVHFAELKRVGQQGMTLEDLANRAERLTHKILAGFPNAASFLLALEHLLTPLGTSTFTVLCVSLGGGLSVRLLDWHKKLQLWNLLLHSTLGLVLRLPTVGYLTAGFGILLPAWAVTGVVPMVITRVIVTAEQMFCPVDRKTQARAAEGRNPR